MSIKSLGLFWSLIVTLAQAGCLPKPERTVPPPRKFGTYPTAQPTAVGDADSTRGLDPAAVDQPSLNGRNTESTQPAVPDSPDSPRVDPDTNPPATPTDSASPEQPGSQPSATEGKTAFTVVTAFKKSKDLPNLRHGGWNGVCLSISGTTDEKLCTKKKGTDPDTEGCWVYNKEAQDHSTTVQAELPESGDVSLSFNIQIYSGFCNEKDDAKGFVYSKEIEVAGALLKDRVKCFSDASEADSERKRYLLCLEDTASAKKEDFKFDDVEARISAPQPFKFADLVCEQVDLSKKTCAN